MGPSLGRVAARGVLWTGFGQVLRQVIQIVSSIVLARLLLPADFGLLGMAIFSWDLPSFSLILELARRLFIVRS